MTHASQEYLLARAKSISHELWRSFSLPVGMRVTAVGPRDYVAIDGGYRVARDITYTVEPGGRAVKGTFIVHDSGMRDSNDHYMEASDGSVLRRKYTITNAMRRFNAGYPPFDRDTTVAEKAFHLGYWTKNNYPFDAWHETEMNDPSLARREGGIISATFPIKFFESKEDLLPQYGTFKISFDEMTYEISQAQCYREDGTPYRSIREHDLNKVYADAGLDQPSPSKSRRLREPLQHMCEGRAESVWREFSLLPGLRMVSAGKEFAVVDRGVDFEFTRDFVYSEDGAFKRGKFCVRVTDSSSFWKAHWIDDEGHVQPEFHPVPSEVESMMTDPLMSGIPPKDAEECVERLAITAWKQMSFDKGVEAFSSDPFIVRYENDCIIAEREVRVWVPNGEKFGPAYPSIPEVGVFRVEMNAAINAIVSVECVSRDGISEFGRLGLSDVEDLYEMSGVSIGQPAQGSRSPRR